LAEAREVPAKPFLSKLKRGDRRPGSMGNWFAANWTTVFMLLFIFVIALFVRSYFGYETASENGYIWSGGSDSYYWGRILEYNSETGKQLYWDPLTNYPDGIRNPRPPFFSFSIVVPAAFIQDMFSSMDEAVLWTFMWSTAFWGALTVVPTYFLGKETFGRRAGLAAAFFLALMPSHVQRSVLSDADHDSFILFFIVLTFYFVLKAVKSQEHRRWVESWKSVASIRKGLGDYVQNSRTPMLYAALAGVSYASVMMAWVGFGYVTVLILAYYIVQVLLNKFRNTDSFSVTALIFITMSLGYLLAFPVYYEQSLISVRFDVPVYLFIAALFFGMMFVVSRDYPWTLTLPAVFTILAGAIIVIDIYNPALADAILSGQGYFVQNKLYSTIAEARAPQFSELALSFGMVTFFMSLIGMFWALIKVPKHATAEYIFIVAWMAAAIFMAISAGRFMFNAAPAFAVAAGWVLVLIVDRLDFNSVRKSLFGASGSYWQIFKKSVKIRHVVGVLFLAFMVILPNVWYAVDAGIPSETKVDMDRQIYLSMPEYLRPSGYDAVNGSVWYLGAFGYSLPLPSYYFPAAWEWFAQQDSEILPESDRPAYVSWWDYGFEAIQAGKHPTVADNFQNGYQLTGNVIMAQSEAETVALFAYRLIQSAVGDGPDVEARVFALLEKHGVDSERVHETLHGEGQPLIDDVLADPTLYGPMASDLSEANARIVVARTELAKLPMEQLVILYDEVCDTTGYYIRYFNVDSRMFPMSGTDTGIFYAPAKLSDRRIVSGSTPIDFYEVVAVDSLGNQHSFENVTSDMTIVDYALVYKSMFYDSMFYRAMVGFSGSDLGLANDGLPGYSGSVENYEAMPGWNLTHFRMVYRTAYYNPFPVAELSAHRDAWRAVSLEEAVLLKQQIDAGEIEGYIDASSQSYYSSGTVFLEFYLGAYVNGTLTTEEGQPVAGIRVTVQDEYGIPHQTTMTDSAGQYSVLAPFGNVTLVFSEGDALNTDLTGSNTITTMQFNVTDDQAMRMPYDLDNDGVLDYIITRDYVMRGTNVEGTIYWDNGGDGNFTEDIDENIPDVYVFAQELTTGSAILLEAADGTFSTKLAPGKYRFYALVQGVNMTISESFNVTAGSTATPSLGIRPASVSGTLAYKNGVSGAGVVLSLASDAGLGMTLTADSSGNYSFGNLVAGQYTLSANLTDWLLFGSGFSLAEGDSLVGNWILYPSSTVEGQVLSGGTPISYASVILFNSYDPSMSTSYTTDGDGRFVAQVPKGEWTAYASYFTGTSHYSGTALFDTFDADEDFGPVYLKESSSVTGNVKKSVVATLGDEYLVFEAADGSRIPVKTGSSGTFDVKLPKGTYMVTCASVADKAIYYGQVVIDDASESLYLLASSAILTEGDLYLDSDAISGADAQDIAVRAEIWYTIPGGAKFTATASDAGEFSLVYPTSTDVTLGVAVPGYSGWTVTNSFGGDVDGLRRVAIPDSVAVTGRLTCEGAGVMGVSIGFIPDSFLMDPVYVETGPGGYYSAFVPPGEYTVTVDDDTTLLGGEKYIFEKAQGFEPTGTPVVIDIDAVKKVEIHGTVTGVSGKVELKLSGPEEKTLSVSTIIYSDYVLPGTYRVYATATSGATRYANISLIDVTYDSRQHDILLSIAQDLSGTITIGGGATSKQTTVTATASTGEQVSVKSTTQGQYSLDLPAGVYTMSYALEDFYVEGSQLLFVEYYAEEVLTVTNTAILLNPSLTMRQDNITFSGHVSGLNGDPVQAEIALIVGTAYGKSSSFTTAVDGSFSVQVQPGDYTVYVTRVQDKSIYMSTVHFTRNVPSEMQIELELGSFLTGTSTLGGSPTALDMSLSGGNAKVPIVSENSGYFEKLLPPGSYTLSASATQTERGISISYSSTESVIVEDTDEYVAFDLARDSKRSVTASWDRDLTQTAAPGVQVEYSFTVENTGNVEDTYLVTFTGSGFNVTFLPSEVNITYGVGNKTTIIAQVTAQSGISAGETKVSCLVRSKTLSSVRADFTLYLNVTPVRSLSVSSLNVSSTVLSRSSSTSFQVNNTGNAPDEVVLQISNADTLAAQGWTADIIDPETGESVDSLSLAAFEGTELLVNFTATRSSPDPSAVAVVYARSANITGVGAYGPVPVQLPDLAMGPGYLDAARDDVTYGTDVSEIYVDIALLASLVALLVTFFLLRRKKGLGGGAKK
jgi:dolichyl-diphosphooligosaccharide--protein glycosyltransferase